MFMDLHLLGILQNRFTRYLISLTFFDIITRNLINDGYMRKRTSIIGALLLNTFLILVFLVAIILVLWFSQNFLSGDMRAKDLSFKDAFLNISNFEIFGIFSAAIIMTSIVIKYVASNIRSNFAKFNQFFLKAAHEGKMIDEKDLKFKEFATLANSVNDMTKKANEAKKRLEFNKKYLQTILDAQKNIVLVQSREKLERANQAFYDFVKVQTIDEFKEKYKCIGEFFVQGHEGEYLPKEIDGVSWANYIIDNPQKIHKVKIMFNELETVFEVNVKPIKVDENNRVVITFNNISELEEQKRAFEKASSTDALTKIANRMKFDNILEQQIEMSKRYNHKFCLILFDIDNFKKINDNYGHNVGDNILVELARLVKSKMRRSDTFARWGGEEFAIILPQSTIKTAVRIAEKLCLKISFHVFSDDLRITCSFGVCEYKKAYDLETLIKLTDEKLYIAKNGGKNQVKSAIN